MLIRIANNISQFPAHTIQILTTAVLECHQSGSHSKALEYAIVLMKSENRNLIDVKYKRKIEQLVRYHYIYRQDVQRNLKQLKK